MEHNYIYILIVTVALASFGLGRLSAMEPATTRSSIQQTSFSGPQNVQGNIETLSQSGAGTLVASARGTKYHYPWCSGAQRILDDNKVWFQTSEEARESGYLPASNCKGLE